MILAESIHPKASRTTVAATVATLVIALLSIGMLIVCRRLAGVLYNELPRDAMLATAITTTATLACARVAWRRVFPLEQTRPSPLDRLIGWSSSTALLLLAIGCCYPANRLSDWLIWLPLLVADQLWRQTFFDADRPWMTVAEEPLSLVHPPAEDRSIENSFGAREKETCDSQEIVQQLFRLREEDHRESIYGTLRADFCAGQRTAVLHVGFCPPLEYLPEIEAEPLPGLPASIKVVQAFAHGARLDVRLASQAESDCHLWIDMAATPPCRATQELRA